MLVVVYIVMSNHVHVTILASDQGTADAFAVEIKRMFSMYFAWKYGRNKVLKYLDAGCKVDQYQWSAYRALFPSEPTVGLWPVSRLSTREVEKIFHTNTDISSTGWKIDDKNRLDPASACEAAYAEAAFNNDISYFYRALGVTDNAVMEARFMDGPRTRLNDQDFFRLISDTAGRWFNRTVDGLSLENKIRLAPYLYHVAKTTPAQIARGLGLEKKSVERLVKPR